jgi:hypothetical protein
MANSIDLQTIFNTVTQQLAEKKDTLNEADSYNHNHGDHMVKIFNLVQNAVAQNSDKPVEEQLSYASKEVQEKGDSGSAALYAQGLSKAAERFSGKELNENTIGLLLQSLFSAEKPEEKPQSQDNDIVGSLLSSFMGQSNNATQTDQSFGFDDILQAGLTFYQSKQNGDTNMEAIKDAILSGSPMRKTPHREQSASIVTSTIMNLVGNLKR